MNRDAFRSLQPNTRIVINDTYHGKKNRGRLGIFVKKIGLVSEGVIRIHLDNKKTTDDIHYRFVDTYVIPEEKKEESVLVDKMEITVDEEASKDETDDAPIDPGD